MKKEKISKIILYAGDEPMLAFDFTPTNDIPALFNEALLRWKETCEEMEEWVEKNMQNFNGGQND